MSRRNPHVCIVGAGFAGLRCADVLLQHGAKVTIFEARNRLGGRVAQSSHLGHSVDLGPNWIHGTDHNPILDIAKETGTVLHSWGERQAVVDQSGKTLSAEEASELSERLWGIIADAFKHSNENFAAIPASESLMDFIERKLEEDPPGDWDSKERERKHQNIRQMAEMWGAFVGTSIQRQSLKFFWLEECIEGENLFVAETYEKILAKVAQPAIEGAQIKYERKVSKITSGLAETSAVRVETSDGMIAEFDEVVMTAPLGWLKRNQSVFAPPLPSRLSQAINSIGYGQLDKVYITFPTAFWDTPLDISKASASPTTSTTAHQNAPNTTATTAPLHHPPTSSAPSSPPSCTHYPGFTHWLSPHYAPSNPSHWDQQGCNLAALPPRCAHPTLLFYIYGANSTSLASQLASCPASEHLPLLTSFFAPYFSRLPHYAPSSPSCVPVAALATCWASDEFAGFGSYSNFQVGLEEAHTDIQVMREGMPERGVWLAGEHTAPFVALGTSTGAWWSGEAVGRRIGEAYGLEASSED
ncbi:hypothetical protein BJ546DRAFT_1093769 [Cryomyces antarcticus]